MLAPCTTRPNANVSKLRLAVWITLVIKSPPYEAVAVLLPHSRHAMFATYDVFEALCADLRFTAYGARQDSLFAGTLGGRVEEGFCDGLGC